MKRLNGLALLYSVFVLSCYKPHSTIHLTIHSHSDELRFSILPMDISTTIHEV